MGTHAHVIVVGSTGDSLLDQAFGRIAQLEERWSRFLPESEVSALNQSNGEALHVSDDTIRLAAHAAAASRLTNGAFNPLMERQLVAAGYDRSFEVLVAQDSPPSVEPAARWTEVAIDPHARTVALPAGVGFDPGGIGKGLAADIAVEELIAAGANGALVSLGGDLAVSGQPPEGDEWVIGIREPALSDELVTTVSLVQGGLATSTTARRRWGINGAEQHHILDPSTGLSATAAPVLASVIAGSAWWAEAAATAMIVGESVDSDSCAFLTMTADGSIERGGQFSRFEA